MGQTESQHCKQCSAELRAGKCQTCGPAGGARKGTLPSLFRKNTAASSSTTSLLKKQPSLKYIETNLCQLGHNYALVFIKPSAPKTDLIRARIESHFAAFKVRLTSEGVLAAKEIADKGIIDQHYFALASNAMDLAPSKQPVQLTPEVADKFKQEFGVEYSNPETVLTLGQLLHNNPSLPASALNSAWTKSNKLKIAGGFYVGRLEELESDPSVSPEVRPLLVVNGFYNAMRSDYVTEPHSVLYFTAEWKEADLSWKDFRALCIGATDPALASPNSLRGKMLEHYADLGLEHKPNVSMNCVHASAGPIEAIRERSTWIQFPLLEDPFTKMLVSQGVPAALIERCANNETITIGDKTGPAFDLFEDVDSSQVIKLVKESRL